jgi:hypothetical protein
MSAKSERKAVLLSGWKRVLGHKSAWASHKARQCQQSCPYCGRRS